MRRGKRVKKKKRMEFSKKIFFGVSIGVALITIFSCIMSWRTNDTSVLWRTNDTSVLSYIIGGMFAELATATGFYYNKAKAENVIKIKNNPNYSEDESEVY